MPVLSFSHPTQGPLTIDTGMNEIEWGYHLNTQRYPTYGGEVVQILSCYIDDVTIVGDLPTYADLEMVTGYFVSYLRSATQAGQFDDTPITMVYGERGWQMDIRPKDVPAFRYGRDVVVPQWKLTAAVVNHSREVGQAVYDSVLTKATGIDLETFAKLDGAIGYIAENPFSNPFPNSKSYDKAQTDKALGELADAFQKLIPSYSSGDFSSLITSGSAPAFLLDKNSPNSVGGNDGTSSKSAPKQK